MTLSNRTLNTLTKAGITASYENLSTMSLATLSAIKGIGETSLKEIRDYLIERESETQIEAYHKDINKDYSLFTLDYNNERKGELKAHVAHAVSTMYDFSDIAEWYDSELKSARGLLIRLKVQVPRTIFKTVEFEVDNATFAKSVKDLDKPVKAKLYEYRNVVRRVVLLQSIIDGKVKLAKVARDTIEKTVLSILNTGKESVTLSEVIHNCTLKPATIVHKNKESREADMWDVDEARLQFVNDLCQLDFLDMRISDHTHMISIPSTLSDLVDSAKWEYMAQLASYLNKKTILLEPAPVSFKNMITTSSWYYETPSLSPAQIEFVNNMHQTKFEFVEDAEDLIEGAYKSHLKLKASESLPNWAVTRVEFFKEQIRASKANGGHYVQGKFDSALRWYFLAEIGHLQSSEPLRKLVRVSGLADPVKYDMSNNVVQMYAVATGIKSLAKYVKLVAPEEGVEDLRLQIAQGLNEKCEMTVFTKDNVKPLFMVWAYNAGKDRILDGVYVEEESFFGKSCITQKVPGLLELTGIDNTPNNRELLWSFWEEVVIEKVPEIVVLKKIFNKIIQANPLHIASWELPDGAVAQYASAKTRVKTLYWTNSEGKQRQHTHHRKEIVENERAAGLLPRSIHSLDAYLARTLVNRARKLGIIVVPNHDSFTFDEQYLDVMFDLVRELFIEIMESGAFESIVSQLNKTAVSLAMKDKHNTYITNDSFGDRLTREDILASFPMVLED